MKSFDEQFACAAPRVSVPWKVDFGGTEVDFQHFANVLDQLEANVADGVRLQPATNYPPLQPDRQRTQLRERQRLRLARFIGD
ncbi:MAG: hypothetical protein M3Y03_02670, partial [Verrucomicrobiota bacterium]|nr:hypothetical protein [Verrucomicrobiota bacterium]